ncbi:MAG: hypothetical protein ACT4PV_11970 [Planctomycetaceae bacterium]
MRSRIAIWIVGLALTACSQVRSERAGAEVFPARAENHPITLYASDQPPIEAKKFGEVLPADQLPEGREEIGRIEVIIDASGVGTWETVFFKARKSARAMGGDGVVITQWVESLPAFGLFTSKGLRAQVIRVADAAPATATK